MGFTVAGRFRLLAFVASLCAPVTPVPASQLPASVPSLPSASRIAALSVPFVANRGQADPRVAYVARTFAGSAFVTTDGRLVYSFVGRDSTNSGAPHGASHHAAWAISETLADYPLLPAAGDTAAIAVADFTGGHATGSVPAYERIRLGQIAPGIEASLRATGDNIEKVFTVAPGADPNGIRVRVGGATRLALGPDGSMIVGTGLGDVTFTAPFAFQQTESGRTSIDVRYRLEAQGAGYAFDVGRYDPSRPLVIDPLIRSTYSGGGTIDAIHAMLVHPGSQEVYVAGSTTAQTFPGAPGPFIQGGTNAFVARYSDSLMSLKSVALYGGGGDDSATAIAILPSTGHIYVAGNTTSAAIIASPGIAINGSITGTYSGNGDAFLVHFDGVLSTVLGATYFGGGLADSAAALAVDDFGTGAIVMAGTTASTNLPVGSGGGAQPNPGGGTDAFLARFSASTLALIRTTYFGGLGDDRANAIAIEPVSRDVIVAGATQSSNLPMAANGALPATGGMTDGFVARFNSDLTTLQQTTYVGGTQVDEIFAIAIHPFTSHIYAAGSTTSSDLRGRLVGKTTKGLLSDAFIVRLYPELTGIKAITYFGDSGDDTVTAMTISPATGEVYLAGVSNSPTLSGLDQSVIQPVKSGAADALDAFVARLDANLTTVLKSTFLGGTLDDRANAIVLNNAGLYIAGQTSSGTFPGVGPSSAQGPSGGGPSAGFISMMTTDLTLADSNPFPFVLAPRINVLPLSIQTSAPSPVIPTGSATAYVDGQPGSTWCASNGPNCNCDLSGNAFNAGVGVINSANPYYVCVRQIAPAALNVISEATLHIGAVAGTFRVTTGNIPGFGCTLDVDGSGLLDALTDGLIIMRALLGMTGTAVTNGAVSGSATRTSWADIRDYLNTTCGASF